MLVQRVELRPRAVDPVPVCGRERGAVALRERRRELRPDGLRSEGGEAVLSDRNAPFFSAMRFGGGFHERKRLESREKTGYVRPN